MRKSIPSVSYKHINNCIIYKCSELLTDQISPDDLYYFMLMAKLSKVS